MKNKGKCNLIYLGLFGDRSVENIIKSVQLSLGLNRK
jgi:hypothetical protein